MENVIGASIYIVLCRKRVKFQFSQIQSVNFNLNTAVSRFSNLFHRADKHAGVTRLVVSMHDCSHVNIQRLRVFTHYCLVTQNHIIMQIKSEVTVNISFTSLCLLTFYCSPTHVFSSVPTNSSLLLVKTCLCVLSTVEIII